MTAPPYDAALLPSPDDAERCAAHAERIGLDPGGTALRVDELIVVDMALPWPKPVWAKEGFTAVPELVLAAGELGRRVRVLAGVPLPDGRSRVVTHRLVDDAHFDRAEHQVDHHQVVPLLELLLIEGLDASPATVVDTAPHREFLICTQGSHDVCCGTIGMAVHAELADSEWALRRVSHTGGHRMAPTGLSMPDGRMWGGVEADDVVALLAGAVRPSDLAPRCRGWMGAEAGPAQVAERAVMVAVDDWDFDAEPRRVEVADDEAGEVRVHTDRGTWTVRVASGRAVPTITCGAPGGLPAKPGREWQVESVIGPA